jgi:hypothetical protein
MVLCLVLSLLLDTGLDKNLLYSTSMLIIVDAQAEEWCDFLSQGYLIIRI